MMEGDPEVTESLHTCNTISQFISLPQHLVSFQETAKTAELYKYTVVIFIYKTY